MSWIKDIKTGLSRLEQDRRSLQKFALVMAIAFAALSLFVFFFGRHPGRALIPLILMAFFAVAGIFFPTSLKPVHTAWMALALAMGWVMSRVILSIVFFVVMTPIGLIMRLLGKDILDQKIDRQKESYWIKRSKSDGSAEGYERQF